MASKKFALNPPLSESDRGGLERKLFGGVCGKKSFSEHRLGCFQSAGSDFPIVSGGVCGNRNF